MVQIEVTIRTVVTNSLKITHHRHINEYIPIVIFTISPLFFCDFCFIVIWISQHTDVKIGIFMNETMFPPTINGLPFRRCRTPQNGSRAHHSDKVFRISDTAFSRVVCRSYDDIYICIRHVVEPEALYSTYATSFETVHTDLLLLGFQVAIRRLSLRRMKPNHKQSCREQNKKGYAQNV